MDTNVNANKQERQSGIELLKIAAIFFIVISHVKGTLTNENTYINFQDYVLTIHATTNPQLLVLSMLSLGQFGNDIFFICSCWFLLDSKQAKANKIVHMLADIWIVSVIILIITYIALGNLDAELIIKSLLPTTFSNNWYLNCYMLFYLIHPYLNQVIYGMKKTALLKACLMLGFLYIFMNYLHGGLFFYSDLTLWITIYFCVAYAKLYLEDFISDTRTNILFVLLGIIGHCGIILLTNYLGLHIAFFEDKLSRWNVGCSPFFILAAFGLFHLARGLKLKSRLINAISGLSLLIYIIHENILLRTYVRPLLFQYIYKNFGYAHILLWVILLAVIIFILAVIASIIYQRVLQGIVGKAADRLFIFSKNLYLKFESYFLRLH